MGRRVAAVTTTVLTGLLIWYSANTIYRDSFATHPPDPRDVRCAEGMRDLHQQYRAAWALPDAPADLPSLDRRLAGLRGLCEREGEAAADAWRRLERWRYRAGGHDAFGRELLDDDARAALAYQSPGTSR